MNASGLGPCSHPLPGQLHDTKVRHGRHPDLPTVQEQQSLHHTVELRVVRDWAAGDQQVVANGYGHRAQGKTNKKEDGRRSDLVDESSYVQTAVRRCYHAVCALIPEVMNGEQGRRNDMM